MVDSFFAFALALVAVLLLSSLSGYVSERAGVVNIGIEGMMTIGALIAAVIGASMKHMDKADQIWIAIIAAVVGGVFAMLHGFASITLKSNQVISGTALNILALGIASFIATAGLVGPDNTDIAAGFKPITLDKNGVVPMWLIVTIVLAIGMFVFFTFTKIGMRYKMVGENPNAVDAAGISVNKYRYIAVFASGAVAGLGGAVLLMTVINNGIFDGSVSGYGFLGLAILIFGQWNIGYITIGTIVFAFLFTLGNQLGSLTTIQGLKDNAQIFKIVPFLLTIVVMIIFSKWSHAPAADGEPFDKALR